MRNLFSRRHPFLMQGLGGLIAVIVMIPVGIYVVQSIVNSKPPQQIPVLAPPSQSSQTGGVPTPGTGKGLLGPAMGTPSAAQGSNVGATYTVKMQPGPNGTFVFNPAKLTIHAGDIVHWVDVNTVPHNIVGLAAAQTLINRAAVNTDPYQVTFKATGTYHYECQVHLPAMVGVITVLPASEKGSARGTPAAGTSQAMTVKMQPGPNGTFVFNPARITIKAGTTVHWVDVNTIPHNIVGLTATDQKFINRQGINANPYQVTFTAPGTYKYQCQIHPGMLGTVTVT